MRHARRCKSSLLQAYSRRTCPSPRALKNLLDAAGAEAFACVESPNLRQIGDLQFGLAALPIRLELLVHELRIVGAVLRAQRLAQAKQ